MTTNASGLYLIADIFGSVYGKYRESGGATIDCLTSGAYVTMNEGSGYRGMRVNIWKALADGVWSSSTTITIAASNPVNVSSSVRIGPYTASNPSTTTVSMLHIPRTSCLVSSSIKTVTIYDDGTFTVS
jgi:hypothetical protein